MNQWVNPCLPEEYRPLVSGVGSQNYLGTRTESMTDGEKSKYIEVFRPERVDEYAVLINCPTPRILLVFAAIIETSDRYSLWACIDEAQKRYTRLILRLMSHEELAAFEDNQGHPRKFFAALGCCDVATSWERYDLWLQKTDYANITSGKQESCDSWDRGLRSGYGYHADIGILFCAR